ncbi:hypothetical protein [Streptomyces sp. NPDC058457]|uniref:hypothetical protein n=1 Tax=Streptomyces sp. NPDC058457 TaxID=3346507 RepID=UPI003669AE7E
MGSLFPIDPRELCFGTAEYEVDPTGPTPRLEVWDREVPFSSTAPSFSKNGVYSSTTTLTRGAATGKLVQAHLFRENEGPNGDLIGKVDIPSLNEVRADFLTRCTEGRPQLEITTGGTFVSVSVASSVPTKVRIQLGNQPPQLDSGMPFFNPEEVVASAVSAAPKVMHKLTLLDELTQPETSGHAPLRSGDKLFFIVLAWDSLGHWDFVWSSKGAAPATVPESFTTKRRIVNTRIAQLFCFNDSDDLSDGEAAFKFVVKGGASPQSKTITWDPMASGARKTISAGTTDIIVNPPDAAGKVTVRVEGTEDDSGSFPPDSNDTATAGLDSGTPLVFPVGPANEQVTNQLLTLDSHATSNGELLSFSADIVFSVNYI